MLKKTILFLTILVLTFGCACADFPSLLSKAAAIPDIEPIQKNDRILILAPHPDDEAIGCAGIIQGALHRGAKVRVVYLTNGDSNQLSFIVYEKRLTFKKGEFIHMGEVRRKEAINAMASLGLDKDKLIFLGYPDFGTFSIFMSHWQDAPAFRSLLTKATSVPYKENFSYGRPYKGESILEDLKSIIKGYKPNKIFVTNPADTNGDHRALYLFLQIALGDLNRELSRPKIYPYIIHCIGWPLPRHYRPELSLYPPRQFADSPIKWQRYLLDKQTLDKKYKAILAYKSQTQSSAFYLFSFVRKNELFGDYPEIELSLSKNTAASATKGWFDSVFTIVKQDTGPENIIRDEGHVSYRISEDTLLIRITKTRGLNRRFNVLFYLFGYSHKAPFGSMPKLRIITQRNRLRVFDGKKMIKTAEISSESNPREFILKVPLKILGEPDFILSLIKKYRRILPMDTISFCKINIRR
jgi:LmbE family N-acetylglucosaminyl deacetylase